VQRQPLSVIIKRKRKRRMLFVLFFSFSSSSSSSFVVVFFKSFTICSSYNSFWAAIDIHKAVHGRRVTVVRSLVFLIRSLKRKCILRLHRSSRVCADDGDWFLVTRECCGIFYLLLFFFISSWNGETKSSRQGQPGALLMRWRAGSRYDGISIRRRAACNQNYQLLQ